MATTDIVHSPIAGANFNRRTTTKEYELGTTARGSANTAWIYCQADGAVATGTATVNASTFQLTDTAGNHTADTAFADNEYGWVRQTAKRTV